MLAKTLLLAASIAVTNGIPRYMGMTQNQIGAPIVIFGLSPSISRQAQVAKIAVRPTESIQDDGFRCRPVHQSCSVITNDAHGTARLYNISASDGSVLDVATLPGAMLHNLNVNMFTGIAWSIASYGPAQASLISIDNNGAVSQLVNLSSALRPGDAIQSGSMTSCSDNGMLWIGLVAESGPDRVIQISTAKQMIVDVFTLPVPLPHSLWALCEDSTSHNALAGAQQSGNTLSYGYLLPDGFHPVNQVTLPDHSPSYTMTKLLTASVDGNGYLTVLYPQGTAVGTPTSGLVAQGDYTMGHEWKLSAIDFYLAGAAWVH